MRASIVVESYVPYRLRARLVANGLAAFVLLLVAVAADGQNAGRPAAQVGGAGSSAAFASTADPVIAAAGDIACDPADSKFNGGNGSSNSCRQKYVSDLLVGSGLAAVLDLGDNQYYCGGYEAYLQSYDKSWGRLKSITHPAVGNHEYITSSGTGRTGCDSTNAGAAGHFKYFGGAAGSPTKGYYSFDIGTWHVIMLNSTCSGAGGCSASTPQGEWLRADLAAHTNYCTLAYWHVPLFSSGGRASSTYKTFWDALYAADADVVLNGHDHIYERFAPQTPTGSKSSSRGIREFVVGTGGANHTSLSSVAANSELRNADTFGVLKLTLHPTSYDWAFVPEAGRTFTDTGTGQCHGQQSDTQPPTTPTNLSATAASPGQVDLSWTASTDNVGVLGYRVYRDGTQVGTTTATTYSDGLAFPNTTYSYTVVAYDAGGNQSLPSNTAVVTTPSDVTPPTAPANLIAAASGPDTVDLSWSAGSDDVRVAGYAVQRDGVQVGTSQATTYSDRSAEPETTYDYQVRAFDDAGNSSDLSNVATVTTPAQPTVLTFAPTDDTYVRADQPSTAFGSAASLQTDGSPVKRILMRFTVSGIAGRTVLDARLRLYCLDSSDSGGRFHRTTSGGWTEGSVTWDTQPAYDPTILASLGSVTAGTWYDVDLGALVKGDGSYELVVESASGNGTDYSSRQGTSGFAPQLIVTTAG
jgi:acid phosphatase type 7